MTELEKKIIELLPLLSPEAKNEARKVLGVVEKKKEGIKKAKISKS